MKLKPDEMEFFRACILPLLEYEPVCRMDSYVQHGNTTCLKHSLAVAYYSYTIGKRLRLKCDWAALVRGAMLHDFFLYDWHVRDKSRRWHGFTHPKAALSNANRHFIINRREREIILKHMWPLTPSFPRCREAALVCLVDKVCSVAELFESIVSRFYRNLPALIEG